MGECEIAELSNHKVYVCLFVAQVCIFRLYSFSLPSKMTGLNCANFYVLRTINLRTTWNVSKFIFHYDGIARFKTKVSSAAHRLWNIRLAEFFKKYNQIFYYRLCPVVLDKWTLSISESLFLVEWSLIKFSGNDFIATFDRRIGFKQHYHLTYYFTSGFFCILRDLTFNVPINSFRRNWKIYKYRKEKSTAHFKHITIINH